MKVSALVKPRLSWLDIDTDLFLGSRSLITQGSVQVIDAAGNVRASLENTGKVRVGFDLTLARTPDGDFQWKRAIAPWPTFFSLNHDRNFSGGIITHGTRPWHQFNTDGSLDLVGPIADSTNTVRPSPWLRFRASYWNGTGAVDRDLELFADIDTNGVRYLRIRRREDGFVAATIDSNGNASLSGSLSVAGKVSISTPPDADNDALRMGDLFNTFMTEVTETTSTNLTLNADVETTIISRSITINKRAVVIATFYGQSSASSNVAVDLFLKEGDNILGTSYTEISISYLPQYFVVMGAKLYGPGTYTISASARPRGTTISLAAGALLRIIVLGA